MESTNIRRAAHEIRYHSVRYVLFLIIFYDWIYKLCQKLVHFDLTFLSNYSVHVYRLWRLNAIFCTPIILTCLLGIPKFANFLQKGFVILQNLVKSFIKNTTIINVPLYVFLFAILIKFYPSQLMFNDNNQKSKSSNSFWTNIRSDFKVYQYLYLIIIVLFLFGIVSIHENRLVRKWSRYIFLVVTRLIKKIYSIVSLSIPTPLSWLILFTLDITYTLAPCFIRRAYGIMTNQSLMLTVLVAICLYKVYKRFSPDPTYEIDFTGDIFLDDVSQLNKTRIASVFYPRTVNDIQYLISKARNENRTISVRGQAHTMGGQTLPSRKRSSRNYVCDLKYMNQVEYDEKMQHALVQAGATWTHVIYALNAYGRSPVVMQSYSSFSVAGTISVNAHGITCDDAMHNSVISIEYVDFNGTEQECNREQNSELFSLIIGGYGLFGIITRLRLMTVPNVKTTLEYIRLQSEQFPTLYDEYLDDPTIEIKIARVDLIRPNNILLFIFRQQPSTTGTVADLNEEARVMNRAHHLIYTYLTPKRLFHRARFAFEKIFGRPLDLTLSSDRNTTMYESAKPMALLYQPLLLYNDTFILQEYFIPKAYFRSWYDRLKVILQEKYSEIVLLNLTIRFVKKDSTTFLAYTKNADCFSFVFYFRIKCNALGDQQVGQLHRKLIQLAFDNYGTFYLPYRQHYTIEQMIKSYPMIKEFFEKKLVYDPTELFSNDWYEYYQRQAAVRPPSETVDVLSIQKADLITDQFSIVEQRRMHSFHDVITNDILREKFRKFLHTVFNAEPAYVIFNYVNRAVRNSINQNDHDTYRCLENTLKTREFAFVRGLWSMFKQILQLKVQIQDLVRQQISIFKQLGYCGKIKNIVSIGDGGRCISDLRRILKINDGRVFILNDKQRLTDIIERNSLFSIGTFIPYDFKNLTDAPIPSESVDLVVCYMGLHHLPQEQLDVFFKMVYRILRPNGLFLFREHHARKELIPLLDVAHMVFNVVTGVDYDTEINEIRAFRTIEQWRSCLRQVGFEDTFVYDEQEDDPTEDIMLTFRKPKQLNSETNEDWSRNYEPITAYPESNYFRPCEWLVVRICMHFGQYLNHTPFYYFPYVKFISHYWSLFLIETKLSIAKYGFQTALFRSLGFQMNVFVGIFTTISFLPLMVFSLFVRLFSPRTTPEYEQLVLEQTQQIEENLFDFQQEIDHRIDNIQYLNRKGFYAIRVPRHHVFTSILKQLALHSGKFNLHYISNQNGFIQVEVLINSDYATRAIWLKQQMDVDIIYEYKNPIESYQTTFIIGVKIKELFSFIRNCANFEFDNSMTIVQIFDYFE